MQIYLAAVYTNNYMPGQKLYEDFNEHEKTIVHKLPHILESYHYVGKQRYVDDMRRDGAKVFLDSGAFSAHTLKIKLDIGDYCDYIKRNMDIIRVEDGVLMASVLDGIGDDLQTYRNQLTMEALGVRPLPCFHAGEDERYLEWYVKNYEYITLGGMVGVSTKQLSVWLDRVWNKYLIDGSGKPRIKVHGFGITSIPLMERYPWYSCDSSSWIQSTSFGTVVTPAYGAVSVSEKSPSRHDKGQHVSTFSDVEAATVCDMFERQGFSYERLSTVYQSRAAYNLWAYGEINKQIDASQLELYKPKRQELF